jgi:hypothetical protein
MDYNACKLLCWRLRSAVIVHFFAHFTATLKASPRLSNILDGLSVRVLICAPARGRAQGCGGRRGAGGGRDLLRGAGVRAAADGRVGAAGPPRAMCLMRCGKRSTRIMVAAAACPEVTALPGRPHALCTHNLKLRDASVCYAHVTHYSLQHQTGKRSARIAAACPEAMRLRKEKHTDHGCSGVPTGDRFVGKAARAMHTSIAQCKRMLCILYQSNPYLNCVTTGAQKTSA